MLPGELLRELKALQEEHKWGLREVAAGPGCGEGPVPPLEILDQVSTGRDVGNRVEFRLHLLEATSVDVVFGDTGFQVPAFGKHFETFEALLMNLSPLYREKHAEVLSQKLRKLAASQAAEEV